MLAMATPDQPRVLDRPVDTPENRSVSFGPSTGTRNRLGAREPVPVGPGRPTSSPGLSFPIGGDVVHEFPLQPTKVQRPPLRRETLRRERLLDWLKVKIHHRVVLVTAEAGYGKTTLLADFARHHRRPTMWYRLDDEDRNWVSFIHYLVAAGREIEPDFGVATKGLLAELGVTTGPSRDTIVATFIRDLQSLGSRAATLIIDDYHLVDDVPDVRVVVRELVNRAPERLTLVFVSRQQPSVPLARLRTLGEVAELTAADLRFDVDETERLFRDTYKRPLEPDVLADLADRTEGWAASLEMVNAALRDRSPGEIRAFVRGMTGAHGELYDYLAEEVVGDLDDETQRFLMTTSLLQAVEPTLVEVVGGFSAQQARDLIARTERLGLLSTRGTARRGARRYHPLVREFLEARLRRTFGDDVARDLHRAVARHAGDADWRLAAYHFAAAEDLVDLGIAVQVAVPTIMGSGDFALAESYVHRAGTETAAFDLLVSRMDLHRGRTDSALTHAERAVETAMRADDELLVDHALLNLIAVLHVTAQFETVRDVAGLLAERTSSATLKSIAEATVAVLDASEQGSLEEVRAMLHQMAVEQERGGHRHYLGVTWLNLADIDIARGDPASALSASSRAIQELASSSAGLEVEGARVLRGWSLAQLGQWHEAEAEFRLAESDRFDAVRGETLTEISEVYADLGDRGEGEAMLARARQAPFVSSSTMDRQSVVAAILAFRNGDLATASAHLAKISADRPHGIAAFLTRLRFLQARVETASELLSAERAIARARHQAGLQGAQTYAGGARVLQAVVSGTPDFSLTVGEVAAEHPASLTLIAEEMACRLGELDSAVFDSVVAEASRLPERWREPLRRALGGDDARNVIPAAKILDRVGQPQDVVQSASSREVATPDAGCGVLGTGLGPQVGGARLRGRSGPCTDRHRGRADPRIGGSTEGHGSALLPAVTSADVRYTGPSTRRAVARPGTRCGSEFAQPNRLLPAPCVRTSILRGRFAWLHPPRFRRHMARSRAGRQPVHSLRRTPFVSRVAIRLRTMSTYSVEPTKGGSPSTSRMKSGRPHIETRCTPPTSKSWSVRSHRIRMVASSTGQSSWHAARWRPTPMPNRSSSRF